MPDAGWSRARCRVVPCAMPGGPVPDAGWSRARCRVVPCPMPGGPVPMPDREWTRLEVTQHQCNTTPVDTNLVASSRPFIGRPAARSTAPIHSRATAGDRSGGERSCLRVQPPAIAAGPLFETPAGRSMAAASQRCGARSAAYGWRPESWRSWPVFRGCGCWSALAAASRPSSRVSRAPRVSTTASRRPPGTTSVRPGSTTARWLRSAGWPGAPTAALCPRSSARLTSTLRLPSSACSTAILCPPSSACLTSAVATDRSCGRPLVPACVRSASRRVRSPAGAASRAACASSRRSTRSGTAFRRVSGPMSRRTAAVKSIATRAMTPSAAPGCSTPSRCSTSWSTSPTPPRSSARRSRSSPPAVCSSSRCRTVAARWPGSTRRSSTSLPTTSPAGRRRRSVVC